MWAPTVRSGVAHWSSTQADALADYRPWKSASMRWRSTVVLLLRQLDTHGVPPDAPAPQCGTQSAHSLPCRKLSANFEGWVPADLSGVIVLRLHAVAEPEEGVDWQRNDLQVSFKIPELLSPMKYSRGNFEHVAYLTCSCISCFILRSAAKELQTWPALWRMSQMAPPIVSKSRPRAYRRCQACSAVHFPVFSARCCTSIILSTLRGLAGGFLDLQRCFHVLLMVTAPQVSWLAFDMTGSQGSAQLALAPAWPVGDTSTSAGSLSCSAWHIPRAWLLLTTFLCQPRWVCSEAPGHVPGSPLPAQCSSLRHEAWVLNRALNHATSARLAPRPEAPTAYKRQLRLMPTRPLFAATNTCQSSARAADSQHLGASHTCHESEDGCTQSVMGAETLKSRRRPNTTRLCPSPACRALPRRPCQATPCSSWTAARSCGPMPCTWNRPQKFSRARWGVSRPPNLPEPAPLARPVPSGGREPQPSRTTSRCLGPACVRPCCCCTACTPLTGGHGPRASAGQTCWSWRTLRTSMRARLCCASWTARWWSGVPLRRGRLGGRELLSWLPRMPQSSTGWLASCTWRAMRRMWGAFWGCMQTR